MIFPPTLQALQAFSGQRPKPDRNSNLISNRNFASDRKRGWRAGGLEGPHALPKDWVDLMHPPTPPGSLRGSEAPSHPKHPWISHWLWCCFLLYLLYSLQPSRHFQVSSQNPNETQFLFPNATLPPTEKGVGGLEGHSLFLTDIGKGLRESQSPPTPSRLNKGVGGFLPSGSCTGLTPCIV